MTIPPSESAGSECHGRSGAPERIWMQGVSFGNSTFNQVAGDQHIIYQQVPLSLRRHSPCRRIHWRSRGAASS
jgi:hypothetical protein